MLEEEAVEVPPVETAGSRVSTPYTRQDLLLLLVMVESRVRRRLHPVRLRLKDSTRDVVWSSSHRSHSYGNLLLEKRRKLREKGRRPRGPKAEEGKPMAKGGKQPEVGASAGMQR